jgi:hypothetical protein
VTVVAPDERIKQRILADPYGEADVIIHRSRDIGATVGSVVPIVGPLVGANVGRVHGMYKAVQLHDQAAKEYAARGGHLNVLARHPYATGLVSTAGLFPVGAGTAGLAIGHQLSRAAVPQDLAAARATTDDEKLDHPYELLTRNTVGGELIGGALVGTAGTLAGRHYGQTHAGAINASLTKTEELGRKFLAGDLGLPISRTPRGINMPGNFWKYGLGVTGAVTGFGVGAALGSVPGILGTIKEHGEAAARAEAKGQKLPYLVRSPYLAYLGAGAVTTPIGLGGAKNLAFENVIQYKRQQKTPPADLSADLGGFASHLHRTYLGQPEAAVAKKKPTRTKRAAAHSSQGGSPMPSPLPTPTVAAPPGPVPVQPQGSALPPKMPFIVSHPYLASAGYNVAGGALGAGVGSLSGGVAGKLVRPVANAVEAGLNAYVKTPMEGRFSVPLHLAAAAAARGANVLGRAAETGGRLAGGVAGAGAGLLAGDVAAVAHHLHDRLEYARTLRSAGHSDRLPFVVEHPYLTRAPMSLLPVIGQYGIAPAVHYNARNAFEDSFREAAKRPVAPTEKAAAMQDAYAAGRTFAYQLAQQV